MYRIQLLLLTLFCLTASADHHGDEAWHGEQHPHAQAGTGRLAGETDKDNGAVAGNMVADGGHPPGQRMTGGEVGIRPL